MLRRTSLLLSLAAAALALAASSASAQYFDNRPAEQPRSTEAYSAPFGGYAGGYSHDSGLMLRFSGGIGHASTRNEFDVGILQFRGATIDYNFAIGGIVAYNLGIHATLFGWAMPDPAVYLEGDRLQSEFSRGSLTAIGPGLTYWLGDSNVYLTGSGGLAFAGLEGARILFDTDPGFAFDIGIGKEWWTGPDWGLGIAAGFMYHSIGSADTDQSWTGTSFGVRFSATFN